MAEYLTKKIIVFYWYSVVTIEYVTCVFLKANYYKMNLNKVKFFNTFIQYIVKHELILIAEIAISAVIVISLYILVFVLL